MEKGENSKKANEFKFKYIFEDDYNPKYVNGAYGGVGPKGEIVVHFYLERQPLPISQTYSFSEDGQKTNEIESKRLPEDLKRSFVRFIETGVVLNHQSAKVIHKWLGEKIEALEKMIEEEKKLQAIKQSKDK